MTNTYTSMCYCKKQNTYETGKEQINCRFIGAMFFVRAHSLQCKPAQKTVFNLLKVALYSSKNI